MGLTLGRYAKEVDLIYIVFDNEQNRSTGGQNTYQKHLDYISIAKSSGFDGFDSVVDSVDKFKSLIENVNGLSFIHVKCGVDSETPRPPLNVIAQNSF